MTIDTHSIVGLGLGVVFARRWMPPLYWAVAASLPIIPNLGAFSVASYGDSIPGHRGLTHNLVFSAAARIAVATLTCRRIPMRFWLLAVVFSLITASHCIMDPFIHGGAGIPLLFINRRLRRSRNVRPETE
jgi:inner membrane protein